MTSEEFLYLFYKYHILIFFFKQFNNKTDVESVTAHQIPNIPITFFHDTYIFLYFCFLKEDYRRLDYREYNDNKTCMSL